MGHIPLLPELTIIALVAVVVTLVVRRIHLPTAAGLLLSGALVGPDGLGFVDDVEAIEVIAEIGVVLLLFTIGLEFSLGRLRHIFRHVALGGLLQVGVTIGVVAGVSRMLGGTGPEALLYGFVCALSSTAIVLRALADRSELDAPHGRFIVGVLIFQDLCVVPMVLLVPLLSGEGEGNAGWAVAWALAKAAVVVGAVLLLARSVVPRLLNQVEASRSKEAFLLAVLSICIGTAWLTSLAGLSLALGAFLGGLVVADTEHSHRALGDMLPLRDVFVSVFFISLGMFFDVRVVIDQPAAVALLLLAFVAGKGLIASLAALLMRFPPRAAWLAGVGLAQFGEFGFVLIRLGTREGVVEREQISPLLCAGILSMFLTPLLVQRAPHVRAGERLMAPLARLLRARTLDEPSNEEHTPAVNQVVIVGYGPAGRITSAALRKRGISCVVLELNAENVRDGKQQGYPVFYADATSAEALAHAGVQHARAVVVLINDRAATLRVVATLRREAPGVPVLARTHYMGDTRELLRVGASEVVIEEVEGAMETLARVLRRLDVPRNVIDGEVKAARSEWTLPHGSDNSARSPHLTPQPLSAHRQLAELEIEHIQVVEGSSSVGRSARQLDLRTATGGATLIALRRGDELLTESVTDAPLQVDDIVYVIGNPLAIGLAVELLGGAAPPHRE